MVHLNELILAQADPFEFIYEGISFIRGKELYDYLTELYNQVVIDHHLHPDDDFETIIEYMLDIIESR